MTRVEPDAVDEALTDLWMANTLCLTFLALNAIAFACLGWAAPLVADAIAAQGREPGIFTALLLGLGEVVSAHPWIGLGAWVASTLGAVGLHVVWEDRKRKIRLLFWLCTVPFALTLAICIAALLA